MANPTPGQAAVLAQIAQNESSNRPTILGPMTSSGQATGLYQITDGTWQWVASITGVGTQYSSAAQAPVSDQTTNALWLLNKYGPNATITWAASAPPGGYPDPGTLDAAMSSGGSGALVDISGAAASTPTADILNQLGANVGTALGTDATTGGLLLAAGIAAAALVFVVGR